MIKIKFILIYLLFLISTVFSKSGNDILITATYYYDNDWTCEKVNAYNASKDNLNCKKEKNSSGEFYFPQHGEKYLTFPPPSMAYLLANKTRFFM